MTHAAHSTLTRFGVVCALLLCLRHARAEVITYTLGIHMNCPYGLAR